MPFLMSLTGKYLFSLFIALLAQRATEVFFGAKSILVLRTKSGAHFLRDIVLFELLGRKMLCSFFFILYLSLSWKEKVYN